MPNETTKKRRDEDPRGERRPVEADTRVTEPDGSPGPWADEEARGHDAATEQTLDASPLPSSTLDPAARGGRSGGDRRR